MNPLNVGTLEASKRLVDAGIVIPNPEFCWAPPMGGRGDWYIHRCFGKLPSPDCIPCPLMAEVWRELPPWTKLRKDRARNMCEYRDQYFENTNSTDALIDMLIWVGN